MEKYEASLESHEKDAKTKLADVINANCVGNFVPNVIHSALTDMSHLVSYDEVKGNSVEQVAIRRNAKKITQREVEFPPQARPPRTPTTWVMSLYRYITREARTEFEGSVLPSPCMGIACRSAFKKDRTRRWRQTIAAEGLGRQQCTMWIHEDEESRSAAKAKVVRFPSERTLERQLADWLSDGPGQAPD